MIKVASEITDFKHHSVISLTSNNGAENDHVVENKPIATHNFVPTLANSSSTTTPTIYSRPSSTLHSKPIILIYPPTTPIIQPKQ